MTDPLTEPVTVGDQPTSVGDLLDPSSLAAPMPAALASRRATGLTADSRAVREGFVFVAVPGARADGLAFAAAAGAAGAVAIVADRLPDADPGAPVLLANPATGGARAALARAAGRLHPGRPAAVVAITGTSGKTSVAVFLRQLWAACGLEAASLGTIGLVTARGEEPGALTTPDPVALRATLERAAREGVTHLALEASSHGLDQRRLDGLALQAAAFLNLSRDHLDYHRDMAAYLDAKLRLVDGLAPGAPFVVVGDDEPARAALARAGAAGAPALRVLDRAAGGPAPAVRLLGSARDGAGQRLMIEAFGRRRALRLPLVGDFQAMNALAALGLAVPTGAPLDAALDALEGLAGVPGRLETVGEHRGAPVIVDYAHKPEALARALGALRPFAPGRLVVVFGAGGDRDAGKRPLMGAAAAAGADAVIVTDDNPRSEDPAAIRAAILAACPGAREVGDRRRAIREAVKGLAPGDLLLIAGKGHESGQTAKGVTRPFDDREEARAALRDLSPTHRGAAA